MKTNQTTFVKRTRDAKKNSGVAAIATRLAKANNDILWKKSTRGKKMFIAAKAAILKKYGMLAKVEWQKQLNSPDIKTKN